ncbi:hypothetical protein [Jannaschia sp. W003]|uniref:hypothetical protein n=1 Tax=Jannaschia sp. W003 TaxID=2867012 RepID=UPI0021A6BAC5|nr:hypothetical protein [Jannaschia sp. W003]UWQ21637.1 hypothetical protein K3554_01000 [Jannaschia sp. W003]
MTRRFQRRIRRAGLDWAQDRLSGPFTLGGMFDGLEARAATLGGRRPARSPSDASKATLVDFHLRPGTDVIELGAGCGTLSPALRARIGPAARHLAVEADPLRAALVCDAAPEAEVIAAAVDHSGAASLGIGPARECYDVPAITLAALLARLPDRFALVCDIGGAEAAMVAAEAPVFERCDVAVLACHPARYPDGEADLDALVAALATTGLHAAARVGDVLAFVRR